MGGEQVGNPVASQLILDPVDLLEVLARGKAVVNVFSELLDLNNSVDKIGVVNIIDRSVGNEVLKEEHYPAD